MKKGIKLIEQIRDFSTFYSTVAITAKTKNMKHIHDFVFTKQIWQWVIEFLQKRYWDTLSNFYRAYEKVFIKKTVKIHYVFCSANVCRSRVWPRHGQGAVNFSLVFFLRFRKTLFVLKMCQFVGFLSQVRGITFLR